MVGSLRDLFSVTFAGALPDLFDAPAIAETRATCASCAMCAEPAQGAVETVSFRPDIKCCTYHPSLQNFLVGAVLDDASSDLDAGRAALREKIARRIGVTPHAVEAPRKYTLLFEASRESSFGRSESMVCPYYVRDGGRCGIWRHRDVVCTTFFCKHTRGAVALDFWTALKKYLGYTHARLADHLVRTIAPGAIETNVPKGKLTREDLEDRPAPDETYARSWSDWLGREEAFYVECARRVRAMSADDFARVTQDETSRALLDETRRRYEAASAPRLEPRLALRRDLHVVPAPGGVAVTSYRRYDSLFLSDALYEALARFGHDEPVTDVLERLRADGIELPESLLLEMQLHAIVVPPSDEASCQSKGS